MKLQTLSTLVLAPALVAALLLPDNNTGFRGDVNGWALRDTVYNAGFNVPCPGCYGRSGLDDFHFQIEVPPSSVNCGDGNITVNGQLFTQGARHASTTGRGVIYSRSRNTGVIHALDAEWETTCLEPVSASGIGGHGALDAHGRGQFLSVVIKALDGRPIAGENGFSASYMQHPYPQILRLESAVKEKPDAASAEAWLTPVSVENALDDMPAAAEPQASAFEDDVEKLRQLEQEAERIKLAIKAQKDVVWGHVGDHFKGRVAELQRCQNLKCLYDAVIRTTHGTLKMIRTGFCSSERRPGDQQKEAQRWQWFWNLPWNRELVRESPASSCRPSAEGDAQLHMASQSQAQMESCAPTESNSSPSHPESLPKSRETNTSGWKPTRQQERRMLIFSAVAIQIIAFLLVPVVLLLFVYRRCFRGCAADRRWQRESRHRADLVRRAHRRHALRRWWQNLWRDARITEYEEKRALIVEQERILECAMQEEIRQLRSAAEAVSSLVSGDSGDRRRSSGNDGAVVPGTRPRERSAYAGHGFGRPRRPSGLSDSASESGYSEPPPTYDDSTEADALNGATVVDGFQYTGATHNAAAAAAAATRASAVPAAVPPLFGGMYCYNAARRSWTPGSSVVGTSVRGEDCSSDDYDDDDDDRDGDDGDGAGSFGDGAEADGTSLPQAQN